jgi:hypothetical protein
MDLGPLIAFRALAEGTPVYDLGGHRIGVVEEVLAEPPGGIFEGVVVHTLPLPGRHRRALPDQISEIHRDGVLLSVGADELPEEGGRRHGVRDRAPSPEPPLQRLARRVLDTLGGRR